MGRSQGIDLKLLVTQFARDRERAVGIIGCLRPVVRVEVDVAMGRDQSSGFSVSVAKLHGKPARLFERVQRLCNSWTVVKTNHIVRAPKPQQRFHLFGRCALFGGLALRKLQVSGGLPAPE